MTYWGGHFPDEFWGGHFPIADIDTGVPPTSPGGSATFGLVLESGVRVTFAWQTGVSSSYAGKERRASTVQDPAQRYEGNAVLTSQQTRAVRTRLAQFAAAGQPFLLGLPYEELAIRADSAGAVVYVQSTAQADWAVEGGRVLVRHAVYGSVDAVIQSVAAQSITIDVTPGDIGRVGASIMPAMPVYLDPQQSFARARTEIETWSVRARNAVAGFTSSAQAAQLLLDDPITHSGVLQSARFVARSTGAEGNLITITMTDDALTDSGELSEVGNAIHIKFAGGSSTVLDLANLLLSSSLIKMLGTWNDADILVAADDEIATVALSGGVDAAVSPAGIGATLATFGGRPVWDVGLDTQGSVGDSMHSLTEARDLGGLPYIASSAAVPDWGRGVNMTRQIGSHWQWAKLFLYTVKGRFRSWWLPTMRADLLPLSVGTGTLTVTAGENAGDPLAWFPAHRSTIRVETSAGAVVYATITAAVDNGDSTVTLTIVDGAGAPLTLASAAFVSWLELVRFEKDEIQVVFTNSNFSISEQARVVQQ